MMAPFMGVLMASFGLVLILGAALRWEWFVAGRKYRRMAEAGGPWAPRLVYGLLGMTLLVFGVLNAMGIWRGGLAGRG